MRIDSRFRRARDPRDHGVTLRLFLSPLRHMEQLLLVTSCDSPAGIGASLRTHAQRTDGHRLFCWNSKLFSSGQLCTIWISQYGHNRFQYLYFWHKCEILRIKFNLRELWHHSTLIITYICFMLKLAKMWFLVCKKTLP